MYVKTNIKLRIAAVAATVIALLIGLLVTMPRGVRADEWDDGEQEGWQVDLPNDFYDHVCNQYEEEQCYESIYYFTDNAESELYVNLFMREMVDIYSQMHTVFNGFYWYDLESKGTQSDDDYVPARFGSSMYDFYDYELWGGAHDYSSLYNSLVIFETRKLFPIQVPDNIGYVVTDYLEQIFKVLHNNGCKIMFVCGTDEHLYESYGHNSFLDYVDIHVNTDIYSYFMNTVFSHFKDYGVDNSVIILDSDLSQFAHDGERYTVNAEREYHNGTWLLNRYGFVDSTLIPFIRLVKGMYCIYDEYKFNINVLNICNIRILCHIQGYEFFDICNWNKYVLDPNDYNVRDLEDYFNENKVYFIGTTRQGISEELMEVLTFTEDRYAIVIDKYVFIENESLTSESCSAAYTAGLDKYRMAQYLYPIIYDFLFNREFLSNHNNWEGRCEITSKPFVEGDGWLIDFAGDDQDYIFRNCFEDDIEMFNNLYGVF
ncbi:hypothetical protein [Anaerocaecibacter muris]|uniref:hypothetical protein n=1 Tax=Anaerocaecibacter muris TaxID=2941513 RepID=UPI00204051D6|nr:hypothetical protein [Anaerocaecibacter muris]